MCLVMANGYLSIVWKKTNPNMLRCAEVNMNNINLCSIGIIRTSCHSSWDHTSKREKQCSENPIRINNIDRTIEPCACA